MERLPEPDLMDDEAQAIAYAQADFEVPHAMYMALFQQRFARGEIKGRALDLGCGPGDIVRRFALTYPEVSIDAVDGAEAMLRLAETVLHANDLAERINLIHDYLPSDALSENHYEAVISNSLLHHLKNPMDLWRTVRQCGRAGAVVFVMDLMRPQSLADVRQLVAANVANEPEVLQQDFYNSLLAAYTLDEIKAQLIQAGLDYLAVEAVSDRHLLVSGRLQ